MYISRIGTGSSCSSTHQSGPKTSLQSGAILQAKLIPDAILFHFCLLWNSCRKAWWWQKFLPLLLISAPVIFTISLHGHGPLTSTTLNRLFNGLIQKRSKIFPKFPWSHVAFPLLSKKREPSYPRSVWQATHSWWQQARAHKAAVWPAEMFYSKSRWHRVTYSLWLCRAVTNSLGVPSRLLHPQIPPQRHWGKEEIPQLLPRTSHEGKEIKETIVRCVMVTTHRKIVTATRWVIILWVFCQRVGFPNFLLFYFFKPNFPLRGAVQGLCFPQRADSKSSFTQEKNNTKPGDTWTDEETC